jgi:hypothetical protein
MKKNRFFGSFEKKYFFCFDTKVRNANTSDTNADGGPRKSRQRNEREQKKILLMDTILVLARDS